MDQAVEKAGALRFLLKQAETMIETLREERDMTTRVRAAVSAVSSEHGENGNATGNGNGTGDWGVAQAG